MMENFDDIRPYEAGEMKQAFEDLLHDRQFQLVLKGFAPWLPKTIRNGLLRLAFTGVKTPLDFQKRFMKPVVKLIMRRHTDGCKFEDDALKHNAGENRFASSSPRYTFVSNHRDIVLDSAILDVMLVENGYPTTVEIGIGDNLLIYPWIKRLVRMNKAFTVRRGLSLRETLLASQHMSRYIHYAVNKKRENIWIAQREGRAKDSDDRTQEAVLKMLSMGGDLRELNIVPLTISYEYDPCDYLKAQEFQQKRDNPQFRKSRQDDLDNMRTGIFGYKGHVVYHAAAPINLWLDDLKDMPQKEFFAAVAQRMDHDIHRGYTLFPCNYIAADLLASLHGGATAGAPAFANCYTARDVERFEAYLARQLAKVSLPNPDMEFLRERMLTMYANPLRNYFAAHEKTV